MTMGEWTILSIVIALGAAFGYNLSTGRLFPRAPGEKEEKEEEEVKSNGDLTDEQKEIFKQYFEEMEERDKN